MRVVRRNIFSAEVKSLLISGCAVCALPAWIWLSKDRPMRAATPRELAIRVSERQESKDDFWRRLPPRHGDLTVADAAWQNPQAYPMRAAIAPFGADDESGAVLDRARRYFGGIVFPVFAERGFVEGRPVWVVAGAQTSLVDSAPTFCGPASMKSIALGHSRVSVIVINAATDRVVFEPEIEAVQSTYAQSDLPSPE